MLWLICVFFLIMAVFGFWMADSQGGDSWHWLTGIGLTLGLSLLLILPSCGLRNGAGLAEWQAFHYANSRNYKITVDETASYLSQEQFTAKLVEGSIEKLKQAGYVSERIKEWRDSVNEYNTTIASMQYFNRNVFTGVLVPNEVEDMRLLIIK